MALESDSTLRHRAKIRLLLNHRVQAGPLLVVLLLVALAGGVVAFCCYSVVKSG